MKSSVFLFILILCTACVSQGLPGTESSPSETQTEVNSTVSAQQQALTGIPGTSVPAELSAVPDMQLSEVDRVVFTIPNFEPWSGREGDARPNWLGWGAETFAVAPDGSFWIADTAVYPNRLLHYSPLGELLQEISLENQVAYAYSLAITQSHLWVLDIFAQDPKIVQLDMDGMYKASINIPRAIMTDDGQFIFNGAFNLLIGDEGALLLNGVNGYYELVDATGRVTVRPLDSLVYHGHIYQVENDDEVTGRLSIFVDGLPLETSQDFFVEASLLGFNPHGSFAVAGVVEKTGHQMDYQVRYYDVSGELLGMARQYPQTFYKEWNHHLVFADESVYQLLSNPNHSVQIVRLGFSAELPPVIENPVLTPTFLTALLPAESAVTDEEQARNTLLMFFHNLSMGNYTEASPYFGGEFGDYGRPQITDETVEAHLTDACITVLWCLPVADITDTKWVSENEFIFHVVFMQPDGVRFEIGACCGGDPAATPPVWQFAYPVQKINGVWKVMREPLFTP